MTTLTTRPVRRETSTVVRGRALVIEARPGYLRIREKGRRFAVEVDYRSIYDLGYKILAVIIYLTQARFPHPNT